MIGSKTSLVVINVPGTIQWDVKQFFNMETDFAGNAKIEAEVVTDVASYGKQPGILSEARLELARVKRIRVKHQEIGRACKAYSCSQGA